MAGVAYIDVSGLPELMARFADLPERLSAALSTANEAIAEEVGGILAELYGPRLAALWETESAVGEAGTLARFRVATDDPRVRGYEYGTRPHAIAAHQPPRALAFMWNGAQAFYVRVSHPGTRPHNHAEALKIALALSAQEQWRAAIAEALNS